MPPTPGEKLLVLAAIAAAVGALAPLPAARADETAADPAAATSDDAEPAEEAVDWRRDPTVARHPGSYLGGSIGYANVRAWLPENDEHAELSFGPMHTWLTGFRVGDAFAEWFAVGFQIQISSTTRGGEQVGLFDLMLDASFYPCGGLGLRPSFGLGLGFASGREDWEFGGGGPAAVGFAVLYEFRVTRLFVIAPVAQVVYVGGQEFDGLVFSVGIELIKWFATATG